MKTIFFAICACTKCLEIPDPYPYEAKNSKAPLVGEWVVKFQTSFLSQEETLARRQNIGTEKRARSWTCEYSAAGGTAMTAPVQTETFAKQTKKHTKSKTENKQTDKQTQLVNIQQQQARPRQQLYKQRHFLNRQTDKQTNRQTDN